MLTEAGLKRFCGYAVLGGFLSILVVGMLLILHEKHFGMPAQGTTKVYLALMTLGTHVMLGGVALFLLMALYNLYRFLAIKYYQSRQGS